MIRQLVATGPVFYVNGTDGNDNNDGTKARPKRTINAAMTALGASTNSGQNGGVFVAPGEYHERLLLDNTTFATDGYARFLEGDGTNPDSTIICGANQWAERGLYAPGKPLRWKSLGTDSIYFTPYPAATGPGDSLQTVVLGWGELLHRKTSLKALMEDSTYAYTAASTNQGEASGWWWSGDTLYVKRRNGRPPSGLVLHAGYLDDLVDVKRRNWRIANLTFRYAGGRDNAGNVYRADVDPGMNGHAIKAGLLASGSGMVIDSCRFYGLNAAAIYVVHGAGGFTADTVTIANSKFDGLTIGWWGYGAAKSRAEEDANQIELDSRASMFTNNVVTGTFNGIGTSSGAGGPADSTGGSQCEIVGNTFKNLADDAIELDTSHSINTLVYGNRTDGAARAFSQAPTYSGPSFVFYNTFTGFGSGVKAAGGTTGIVRYQQNTLTSTVDGSVAVDCSPGGTVEGMFYENNVLDGVGNGVSTSQVRGPASGGSTTKNLFNWNMTRSIPFPYEWNSVPMSLGTLQSSNNWEKNGLTGVSAFVDSTRANYSVGPSSPALNRGRRITGVNTGLDGLRYRGTAPEIGSEERQQQ